MTPPGDARLPTSELDLEGYRLRLSSALHAVQFGLDASRGPQVPASAPTDDESARERQARLDERSESLTQQLVAVSMLGDAPSRVEALAAVGDILVNLVGCEQFGIYERAGGLLELIGEMPGNPAPFREVPARSPLLDVIRNEGRPWLRGLHSPRPTVPNVVAAVVPLIANGNLAGAILLFALLPQKGGCFAPVDGEILTLLTVHGAKALFGFPDAARA